MTDLDGNVDPGRDRPRRLPRLRRHGGDGLAVVGRADAGGRRPGHVRVHLRRPRRARHRRQHPLRLRPGRGRLRRSSCTTTTTRSGSSSTASPPTGSTSRNTLFVVHRRRGRPLRRRPRPRPPAATASTTPCTYNRVGEINGDLRRMIRDAVRRHDAVHRALGRRADRLHQRQPVPGPTRSTRTLEREMRRAELAQSVHRCRRERHHGRAGGPRRDEDAAHGHRGSVPDADVHAVRRSRLVLLRHGRTAHCATPGACASIPARTSQSFAWNHGDIQDEIASTWVGYRRPGRAHTASTATTWTDHTDVRPTMLDPARPQGRLRPRRSRR